MKARDFSADRSDASGTHRVVGIVAGTRVATSIGWRPVEAIAPGDRVLTFDDGLQIVARVTRGTLPLGTADMPEHLWPLRVPVGALGNQAEMTLLSEQPVMLESDAAEEVFGDPFTLMPAAALDGFRGIRRERPAADLQTVSLCFENDQVVFANIGALFFCPKVLCGEPSSMLDIDDAPYRSLTVDQAEALSILIEADEAREIPA